ncbi:GyrI-like domain-containing protein [Streptomyces sp. NPDC004042]|uniref:GyrI-like domain-containing protein n=1 Tax=Streptomyces sp. NPDC004042 TaxID=3154451 RepID=UPI0033B6E9C3
MVPWPRRRSKRGGERVHGGRNTGIPYRLPETNRPLWGGERNTDGEAEVRHPEVQAGHIAGGRHAVLTTAHTAEGLAHAWAGLFDGLAAQSLTFDTARPVLERYRPAMLARHLCEICVPVL